MGMSTSSVLVVANDIVPGMGMPVAAPGLRAWGLARGLRAHGYDVTLAVMGGPVQLAWNRSVPPPTPPSTLVMSPAQVGDFVRMHALDAVVVTNSNYVRSLGDLGGSRLVYDFFAPKMLELQYEAEAARRDERLAALRQRKLAALAASDAVIVNGAKKLAYVHDWLREAGHSDGDLPVEVVNMPVPSRLADGARGEPIRAVVSGYIQPWSQPGPWVSALRPILDTGKLYLDLLVVRHWGQGSRRMPLPTGFAELLQHPCVTTHDGMEFGDFQEFLSTRDLSIDLFSYNQERELAMVTRTMVALACGLPVVHVPFTECSPLIEGHAAGWLVDGDDAAEFASVMDGIVSDADELAQRREGARRLAREVIEPEEATRPLRWILEQIL